MRARVGAFLAVSLLMLGRGGSASAQEKGRVAGTWSCVARGTSGDDMEYTFNLAQSADQVTGRFTAASGNGGSETHELKNGSFKNGKLELHFEDDEGTVDLTGALDGKDAMKGDWTQSDHGGTWECTREAAAKSDK